tara:strand:- start:2224 stop:3156 length:933 start_codon:yes stop_codon:yes gene_type:complete
MLSLRRGVEIAVINEGSNKNKKIYLYGKDDFSNKLPSEIIVEDNEKIKVLEKDYFKTRKINRTHQAILIDAVKNNLTINQLDEKLKDTYEELQDNINIKLKTELDFINKSTKVFPIPQKYSERLYVPAPSGSGKSTWIGEYLKQLRIKYPDRRIYIFSRVKEDKPLDRFKNLERVDLDGFIHTKPLVEDYAKGILIFDDIDTILDKNLVNFIRKFRDDVLECGRHYKITCISTSHLIMNFHATRTLINEANAVCIFPKGGSFGQIKNFLDRYLGFDKILIEKIRTIPSRWVYIHKEYPQYIIHEKGVLLY